MPKTWFITGCSTGFGRAIAQHLLANGHNVAVTARNPAQVEDLATASALFFVARTVRQCGASNALTM